MGETTPDDRANALATVLHGFVSTGELSQDTAREIYGAVYGAVAANVEFGFDPLVFGLFDDE